MNIYLLETYITVEIRAGFHFSRSILTISRFQRCAMKISRRFHLNFGISASTKGSLRVRETPSDFSHFVSGVTIDDQSKKRANDSRRRLKLSKNSSMLVGEVETGASGRNDGENFSKGFVEIINWASSCENDRLGL